MRVFQSLVAVLLLLEVWSVPALAESMHWNQFRGPNGAGIVAGVKPPLQIAGSIIIRSLKFSMLIPPLIYGY